MHMGKMSGREKLELLAGLYRRTDNSVNVDNMLVQRIWLSSRRKPSQSRSDSRRVLRSPIHNWRVCTIASVALVL